MTPTKATRGLWALCISVGLLLGVGAWGGEPDWPPAHPEEWICPGGEGSDCTHLADDPVKGLAWAEDVAAATLCAAQGKPLLIVFSTRAKGVAGAPDL